MLTDVFRQESWFRFLTPSVFPSLLTKASMVAALQTCHRKWPNFSICEWQQLCQSCCMTDSGYKRNPCVRDVNMWGGKDSWHIHTTWQLWVSLWTNKLEIWFLCQLPWASEQKWLLVAWSVSGMDHVILSKALSVCKALLKYWWLFLPLASLSIVSEGSRDQHCLNREMAGLLRGNSYHMYPL